MCSNFENEDYTISELREAIQSRLTEKSTLENELPDAIVIGVFHVKVDKLKKHLVDKQQNIVRRLLLMHAEHLRTQIDNALGEFESIYQKLRTDPLNIEQLVEMREWVEGLKENVESQRKAVQKVKADYEALETFHWILNDEDFEAKWQAMLFPFKIHTQVSRFVFARYTRLKINNSYSK